MSGLTIKGFENVVMKEFRVYKREGKNDVYFAEFVDATTFDTTGEMLFLGDTEKVLEIAQLKLKPVNVTLQMSLYNGRASINVVEIQPARTAAKVG